MRWSAGANVRQQHSLSHGITLYFDIQLQWAAADQQATICIHSADNHNWMAQQVVKSSLEGQQIHTVQVTTALPCQASLLIGSLNMSFMHLYCAAHDSVAKVGLLCCYSLSSAMADKDDLQHIGAAFTVASPPPPPPQYLFDSSLTYCQEHNKL